MLLYQTLISNNMCENCGTYQEGLPRHHIRARGMKKGMNLDIVENLICLCPKCHTEAHAGMIPKWKLIEIVARREHLTPTEICEKIGLLVENTLPHEYKFTFTESNPYNGCSLEEVMQAYCTCEETEEEAKWLKAEILTAMVTAKMKLKTISSLLGCSPATIRESVRTFKAFPTEETRAKDKSFTHHRIASKTPEPAKWIDTACVYGLSTRQLEEAILIEPNQKNDIKKDAMLEKSERIVRMVNEVLEHGEAPAAWLKEQLKEILEKEDAYCDNHSRIA